MSECYVFILIEWHYYYYYYYYYYWYKYKTVIVVALFYKYWFLIELINRIIILYRGTSSLRHLSSRDTSIQGTQNLAPTNIHIIFLSVSSVEGTPLFRGKGHFFLVLNPRFYLHSGDTLVLRMWLTTKRVDKLKCTMITMIAAFTTWTIIISLKLKLMYCTCRNNNFSEKRYMCNCVDNCSRF